MLFACCRAAPGLTSRTPASSQLLLWWIAFSREPRPSDQNQSSPGRRRPAAGTAAVSLAPMGCTPASGGPTSAGAKTADKSQIDQFLLAPADAKNFQAKQAITPVKGQIQVNAWNC